MRRLSLALLTALTVVALPARGATPPTATPTATGTSQKALFAMGCFWCAETAFEGQPGVLAVVSGFAGGRKDAPTYEEVSSGSTGHIEVVEVTFDPARTTYERMLDLFWHNIDPTQADGQFCDRGEQYVSAIFALSEAQKSAALAAKARIEKSGALRKPIVTRVLPAARFWPAEDYHQDFWKKSPVRYRSYRLGCGRDARLVQIWGKSAGKPLVH